MQPERICAEFTAMCRNILKEKLVGVYLHGSLAMGCFHAEKSDIDLLIVVCDAVSNEEKLSFLAETVRLNAFAPEKGIEMSIVQEKFLKPFRYPTPYELHFSNAHLSLYHEDKEAYLAKLQGIDPDLAAHAMITRHYGKVLFGKAIPEVFGEVPREDYLHSIRGDIENAAEDIFMDPVYITLNLCRVLAYSKENLVLSKKAGAEWAMVNLPVSLSENLKKTVQAALSSYETGEIMETDKTDLQYFAEIMLKEIFSCA